MKLFIKQLLQLLQLLQEYFHLFLQNMKLCFAFMTNLLPFLESFFYSFTLTYI